MNSVDQQQVYICKDCVVTNVVYVKR